MAKENKKAALSLEERLDAALVPDWEQPYKVPANWCWTYIRTGFIVSSSKRVHKNEWQADGVPFYRTRELVKLSEHGFVDNELFITSELYEQFKKNYGVPSPGDLLISGVGTIGVPYVIDDKRPFYFKDGNIIWFKNRGVFFPQYIYYLYKSTFMYNQLHAMSAGTTVDTYTIINAENTMLPLPPYAEQQRIVDRIESLFAKLDEAKEKAQTVVDGFEDRKAAILHKAFSGELTAVWAEHEKLSAGRWKSKRFDRVAEVKSNLVDPADYQSFPHIAPDNIEKKTGRLLEYHTIAEDGVKSGKHRFFAGQILYSKIRPYLSKVIVVDFDGLCSADMYPIEPKKGVDTKYLWYFMLSEDFLAQASTAGSRSVLPKINQKELANLTVEVTDIREQKKIVATLDKIFAREQQAKEAAEQVIDQIDTMKKSILARAFRGELGTSDPNDESTKELLKRALQETIIEQPNPTGYKKRRNSEDVQMAKTIMEVLSEQKQVSPEKLKAETSLDIDSFYAELKSLVESGDVVENREDLEVFLEARHEDRQTVD